MPITLITGPMFAEKTTTLLSIFRKCVIAKKKVVLIKHCIDCRHDTDSKNVSTHDTTISEATYSVDKLLLLPELDSEYILIDEGQFFDDLQAFCVTYADKGVNIYISALNGTYSRTVFPSIAAILPHIDDCIFQKSVCTLCGDSAIYSKLIVEQTESSRETSIQVGAADSYAARCRHCYNL